MAIYSKTAVEQSQAPHLLLVGDVLSLRAKLLGAQGMLREYWRNFLQLAENGDVGEFQALPPLAWLVTGEQKYARATRAVFLKLLANLPLAEESVEAQLHAYPVGAPLARFSIFLDWIWDSGILSGQEQRELANGLTTQIYSHCYLRLKGRLPASDNQQLSMAFSCAIAGYLFGCKRGNSPAARRMGREGFQRFRVVLEHIPAGGWSGEGSTYHHQVYSPIAAIFTAFMEEVTGKDYFSICYGSGSVADALRVAAQTINTAGLLPGWDEYGNCAPELKTHLVYLARRSGNFEPLALIERHNLWSENETLAWYNDDKVWTLIFWPEGYQEGAEAAGPASWLNPPVAGRIVARDKSREVLQMWDRVEAGRPGRAHINPNNVEICAEGVLLTSDGRGRKTDLNYFRSEDGMSFAAAHSVVVVDDSGYSYPDEVWHGRGTQLCDLASFQMVRGDVSDLYQTLWGMDSMSRTSCLIGRRLILLQDAYTSSLPHRLTWQLMLRPAVTVHGNRARQRVREGVTLEVAAPAGSQFNVTQISDYPRGFEEKTDRLSMELDAGKEGTIPVVLRALSTVHKEKNISDGWNVQLGGEEMPDGLCVGGGAVSLQGEYFGRDAGRQTLWFGTEFDLSATGAAAVKRLSIVRGQVDRLEVWVNGRQTRRLFEDPSIAPGCPDVLKSNGRFWPSHFDVAGYFVSGINHVAIASSEFRGQSICGPVELLSEREVPEEGLEVARSGKVISIRDGDEEWHVALENESHDTLELRQGTTTDAAAALCGDGVLALAGFTACVTPTLRLEASQPLDVELRETSIEVCGPAGGDFSLRLTSPDGEFLIGPLGVEPDAALPWEVIVRRKEPLCSESCTIAKFEQEEPVFPASAVATADEKALDCPFDPCNGIEAVAAGQRDAWLREALVDPDWRRRVGAVELVGQNGCRWAVPRLLELLAEEEAADLRPEGLGNWPLAKMKTAFRGWARGDLPETTRRGHRLKTVLLEALGRLRADEATPWIRQILERKTDFYPTLFQACQAAGSIGNRDLLPAIKDLVDYPEKNTRLAARAVSARLRSEPVKALASQPEPAALNLW